MLNSCLMVKLPETKTEIIVVKDFGKSCLNYDEEDYLAEKTRKSKKNFTTSLYTVKGCKDLYVLDDSKFDFRSFYDNQKLFINHQAIVYFREYNFKGKPIKVVYKIKPAI
ncbi:hypothetical protein ACTS91_05370 [Empedobacter falsenii]|uniref:hypothetical protein n=1 Tax=unclassified Empedobacter TaxID=2643773 RepID=UPI0025C19EEE|nr:MULTISPECIES: hypothetical protein [unclassified Empedobacter]